jgi:hypothetical protein
MSDPKILDAGILDQTTGKWLTRVGVPCLPGPGQYMLDDDGMYRFSPEDEGHELIVNWDVPDAWVTLWGERRAGTGVRIGDGPPVRRLRLIGEPDEVIAMFPALVQEVRQAREAALVYSPGQAESPGVPPTRYVPPGAPFATLTAEEIAELRRLYAAASKAERGGPADSFLNSLVRNALPRLLDEVEHSRALLKRIEWSGGGDGPDALRTCPECQMGRHVPGCELAALIADFERDE